MVENISIHKDLDLIIKREGQFPLIFDDAILRDVIDIKEKYNFGTVVITDKDKLLSGIITDGDLRRVITKSQKHYSALMMEDVKSFMNKNPIIINDNHIDIETVKKIFKKNKILDLIITNNLKKVLGIIHIHDIL